MKSKMAKLELSVTDKEERLRKVELEITELKKELEKLIK